MQFHITPVGVALAPLPFGVPSLSLSYTLTDTHTNTDTHARARAHFKPGWMTSPLRPGFLYDPGISHFPHQTSAGNAGEHNPLCLSLSLSVSLQLHHAHSTAAEPQQQQQQQNPELTHRKAPRAPHGCKLIHKTRRGGPTPSLCRDPRSQLRFYPDLF